MKFIVFVFFGLLAGALSYNWDPEELQCASELNIDKKWIEGQNNPMEEPLPTDDKMLNDFLECYFKKVHWLINGAISWDTIDSVMTKSAEEIAGKGTYAYNESIGDPLLENFHESLRKCRSVSGSTPGQSCALALNCFAEQLNNFLKAWEEQISTRSNKIKFSIKSH